MKSIDHLPPEEQEHFMLCPDCQVYFDMRDLGEVFEHVHGPNPFLEKPVGIKGQRVKKRDQE